ncbi:MAG: glycosyl transferase [Bacteroidales bacterium]|nr:glycosyl transferase [Bacteroidales bacterium]
MSTSYHRTERLAAMLMARMPRLKKIAKKAYQGLNYILYRREHHWDSSHVLRRFDHEGLETFFGYYDHSPESPDGRYLLFHAVNPPSTAMPLPEEIAWVVVYDLKEEKVALSCSTTSFNWQQGARAMWVDNDRFIFNDYDADTDTHRSRMISLAQKRTIKTFAVPVYDVRGTAAVSLNFDRLQLMRPDYGYRDRQGRISLEALDDTHDGVSFLDLTTGGHQLILTIDQLKRFEPDDSFHAAIHWVNHLMLDPDAEGLIFLHRWKRSERVFHRLMYCKPDGSGLKVLAGGMVSHCTWNGSEEVIGFMSPNEMPGEYHRIAVEDGRRSILAQGVLDRFGDGHPSVKDGMMLFDTYPDRSRMKGLYLLDLEKTVPVRLGSFFESLRYYGPNRCDLHPRWSRDGRTVYFDSVHEGQRRLYAMHLNAD